MPITAGTKKSSALIGRGFAVLMMLALPFIAAAPGPLKPGRPATPEPFFAEQLVPCAGYPPSGAIAGLPACQPVWITVINREETRVIDFGPSGKDSSYDQEYLAKYFLFSYTAQAQGELRYQKDFSEFSVNVQGAASATRMLQLQGSHTWFTLEGVNAKIKWHTENFPKGRVQVRIPFKFGILYPFSQELTTNICFVPMVVESTDASEAWLLQTGTSKICWSHPQVHFVVTPALMKEIVAKKEFQKTFHWQDSYPGEKSVIDNFVEIKMGIGQSGPAPAIPPAPAEEAGYVPLAQYREPPDKSAKTPCDVVKQDLSEAMKLRDAFKDPKLLERAMNEDWDAKKYAEQVNKTVFGPKNKTPECPMETDPTTCQLKIYWNIKKYKDKGFPEACYQADLMHEKVHEANCKKRGNPMQYSADMSFPAKLSQEEVSAYEAKITYLQTWLKSHCQ